MRPRTAPADFLKSGAGLSLVTTSSWGRSMGLRTALTASRWAFSSYLSLAPLPSSAMSDSSKEVRLPIHVHSSPTSARALPIVSSCLVFAFCRLRPLREVLRLPDQLPSTDDGAMRGLLHLAAALASVSIVVASPILVRPAPIQQRALISQVTSFLCSRPVLSRLCAK
jgi:hypothetical protein